MGMSSGQLPLLPQQVQAVQNLLCAPHGKGGNDDLVMVIVAVGDGFRQFVKCRFFVLMITIAVRTLNEQIISLAGDDRIMHQERARYAPNPQRRRHGSFCRLPLRSAPRKRSRGYGRRPYR